MNKRGRFFFIHFGGFLRVGEGEGLGEIGEIGEIEGEQWG